MSSTGDKLIEAAEGSFAARLNGDMYEVKVPEWGEPAKPVENGNEDSPGKEAVPAIPATLYFKPSTLAERDVIYRAVQAGGLGSLVEIIIVRARDEDGKILFGNRHKTIFERKIDPDVINRIVKDLAGCEGLELEEVDPK